MTQVPGSAAHRNARTDGTAMYAIVRDSTYDTARPAHASKGAAKFQDRHSAQAGYRVNIVVDAGN